MSFADTAIRIRDRSFAGYRHQKGFKTPVDSAELKYDLWVSYQTAVLSADKTAVATQYFNNCALDIAILSVENRGREGLFSLHFDHNLKVTEKDADELFETVIGVLTEGLADDSRRIDALHR